MSTHLNLASRGKRLAATIIDNAPAYIQMLILFGLLLGVGLIENPVFFFYAAIAAAGMWLLIIPLGILHLVLIQRRSQTLGKMFMDIQVVDDVSRQRIRFWRYVLLRSLLGGTFFGAVIVIPMLLQVSSDYIYAAILAYTILDGLCIFRPNRKTIHDMIASTVVVDLPVEKRRKKFFDFSKLG